MNRQDQKWPDVLWIARHGESAGNVARERAYLAQESLIDIPIRDPDVALSELGERQANALGRWFAGMPEDDRPNVVLASTYLRARQTADAVRDTGGTAPGDLTLLVDERLREKEFGVLDRLTRWGIQDKYPEQAEFRQRLGKFYHRPPGGESWCDVILRLRSVIDTLTREYAGERVLIVGHSVVVLCFRYLFERLTEEEILAIDRTDEVANCAVTCYAYDRHAGKRGKLVRQLYNFVAPLEEAGEPVTTAPDAKPIAP
ncbi:MAG: histidine phosphatase family protein [Chloroflexota bacterium]|nr:histidine phosphatase family protein [Chloroflexota bacterium]